MSTEVLLNEFKEYSEHPHRVLSQYKQEGKKVIGVLPYYAPVELVVAAGMVPMGIWGSNKKTIALAKEYCATFYCTMASWPWRCCWTALWISWTASSPPPSATPCAP